MLCSLCQHGVTSKIDNKPTGATWNCPCGEIHCRHIDRCRCGRTRQRRYKIGDVFRLLARQIDDNDGHERVTPGGSYVVVSGIEPANIDNPYILTCPATGGWWFFAQWELEREAELTDPIRPPEQGDYLGLGNEHHTMIDACHGEVEQGAWLIEDERGQDFRVTRDPDNDN